MNELIEGRYYALLKRLEKVSTLEELRALEPALAVFYREARRMMDCGEVLQRDFFDKMAQWANDLPMQNERNG